MPPYVSVVLPMYKSSDSFAKIILPVAALKAVDSAQWYWDPTIGDATTPQGEKTLLQTAAICNRPLVDVIGNTWDFRSGI